VASNGVVLVSQPRATMASFAPQTDAAPGKAAAAASSSASATLATQDAVAGTAPDTTAKTDAAKDQAVGQALPGAGKDASDAALLPGHAVGSTPAGALVQASASTASTANAAAVPQPVAPAPNPPSPAPATSASAAASLALPPQAASAQVATSLGQAIKVGSDHIQLQLQPADLGAVDVKLNINHDGRVTMVVSADRSDTLNMLKQDSSSLTQALRDAGLQADNSSLSFNLRGGYQFNQQQQQQQPSYGAAASSNPYASGTADDLGAAIPATLTSSSHSGSLDIHV